METFKIVIKNLHKTEKSKDVTSRLTWFELGLFQFWGFNLLVNINDNFALIKNVIFVKNNVAKRKSDKTSFNSVATNTFSSTDILDNLAKLTAPFLNMYTSRLSILSICCFNE